MDFWINWVNQNQWGIIKNIKKGHMWFLLFVLGSSLSLAVICCNHGKFVGFTIEVEVRCWSLFYGFFQFVLAKQIVQFNWVMCWMIKTWHGDLCCLLPGNKILFSVFVVCGWCPSVLHWLEDLKTVLVSSHFLNGQWDVEQIPGGPFQTNRVLIKLELSQIMVSKWWGKNPTRLAPTHTTGTTWSIWTITSPHPPW